MRKAAYHGAHLTGGIPDSLVVLLVMESPSPAPGKYPSTVFRERMPLGSNLSFINTIPRGYSHGRSDTNQSTT